MPNNIFNLNKFTILDGGLGTMLQAAGLPAGERPEMMAFTAPEKLIEIHSAYLKAGADIIMSNTFGANAKKLAGSGYTVQQVITAAVNCAKEAVKHTKPGARVALDVGPIGQMLEPGGIVTFEEAYEIYAQLAKAGARAGADLVMIETMTDLYEAKAALLAVRENTNLPALVSMTFEENGRTFTGVPIEAMALTLGGLGAAGLGINCSLGPADIMPLAQRLCAFSPVPVFVKPNAGLPNPATGEYTLSAEDFSAQMQPCLEMGIVSLGGCCGTNPATIAALSASFKNKTPAKAVRTMQSFVCSSTNVLEIAAVCPIGERINPTGKKRLQEALRSGNLSYLQTLAVQQEASGVAILDVNVGTPGVDETLLLPKAVKAVQAVCALPLQIDSVNPDALEAALRVYNGKAIVNSTSGEDEKLATILPLCKKYGAAIVGLTLDENGIAETAKQRFAVAEKILTAALAQGIAKEDVYIDCLTLAISAQPESATETLKAVHMVKQQLGLKNVLGVSNISFGLPNRPLVNRNFLTMAMAAGLDLPILNPADFGMMSAVGAFALLQGRAGAAEEYIARFGAQLTSETFVSSQLPKQNITAQSEAINLQDAIEKGLKAEAESLAKKLLASGAEGLTIVNTYLMPALDVVGKGFELGTVFLPQLLSAAGAAGAAFEVIRSSYGENAVKGPLVVLATVKGDVHDIGKNIVKVLLENYNFTVIDLGRDVPPEHVVRATIESGAKLVGLSALMTTTLPAMQETIIQLRKAECNCKVMVGGAVLTPEYALEIGADFYAKDASQSVEIAKQVYMASGTALSGA